MSKNFVSATLISDPRKEVAPLGANNNYTSNKSDIIKNNFNFQRGVFLGEFARFEFLLCETLHSIKKHNDTFKFEMPNTNSARTDLILSLTVEDNALNSKIGCAKVAVKKIKKMENYRNFLAHGFLKLLIDENGKEICLLLTYYNSGQSNKKEAELIDIENLVSLNAQLSKLVDDFENHTKSIRALY